MIQGIIDNFSDSILKVSTYSSYSDSTFISKADLLRNKRLWQTNLSPQKWTTDFELVHNNSREKYKSLYLKPKKKSEKIKEVILANSATVDGQTTAHYIADQLSNTDIILSRLAQGLPMGGELDFLDDGTITQALRARSKLQN